MLFIYLFLLFWFLKVKGYKNETKGSDRVKKMFNRDCQLMGLTWLLAKNKTAYIPTVSAVLRAMMYSAHPHESKCSPDQENMPLAVDSLQFESGHAQSRPSKFCVTVLPLVVLLLFSAFVQKGWVHLLGFSVCPLLFLSRYHVKLSYSTKHANKTWWVVFVSDQREGFSRCKFSESIDMSVCT